MENITSFCINHDILEKGIYISRIDGDIITYDLRMVKPNTSGYLENDGLHTFEHLFATYVRNTAYSDEIIYVGPMGCRTGFYFLCRESLSNDKVLTLLRETMEFIKNFEGAIPGAETTAQCGNYLDHNLEKAKEYGKAFAQVIANWNVQDMQYNVNEGS